MKLRYLGPDKRRRINGRPLQQGEVVSVTDSEGTVNYFLGLRYNEMPEFETTEPMQTEIVESEFIMDTMAGEEE